MEIERTPALVFAALLALLLEWAPGISAWWQALTPAKRTALNAFGVALIAIASMWIGCARGTSCPADPWDAAFEFLLVALLSLAANQGTYMAAKRQNFA